MDIGGFIRGFKKALELMEEERKQKDVDQFKIAQDDAKFELWYLDVVARIKKYPLVKVKWGKSKFKSLYKEGYNEADAAGLAILNH